MSGKDNHVEAGCFAERRGEENENYPDGSGTKGAVSDYGTDSETCKGAVDPNDGEHDGHRFLQYG